MNISNYIKLFFLTFPIFLAIDFTWLGLIAKKFYDKQLMGFERTLRWPAALMVYVLIVYGVLLISVPKFQNSGSYFEAFLWGAFAGLIMYGTYDLTNMSVLADWSWKLVVVDMIWGMLICGTVGVVAAAFSRLIS